VKYERIKFLVVALKDGIEIYAWAPKPYHKFMAFKVRHANIFSVGSAELHIMPVDAAVRHMCPGVFRSTW
jgi:hypothetical protein